MIVCVGRVQDAIEQQAKINGPLDAQAHINEPPCLGTSHVFPSETVKCRDAIQNFVEHTNGITREDDWEWFRGFARRGDVVLAL